MSEETPKEAPAVRLVKGMDGLHKELASVAEQVSKLDGLDSVLTQLQDAMQHLVTITQQQGEDLLRDMGAMTRLLVEAQSAAKALPAPLPLRPWWKRLGLPVAAGLLGGIGLMLLLGLLDSKAERQLGLTQGLNAVLTQHLNKLPAEVRTQVENVYREYRFVPPSQQKGR